MTIHRFFTISLLLAATCYASDILFSLSLAGSELALLSDSSDASAWGTYGLPFFTPVIPMRKMLLGPAVTWVTHPKGKRSSLVSCSILQCPRSH